MKFEKEYFVHYYDSDKKLKLHIVGLMRYLEDIALLQSESLNIGLKYYEDNDVAWLLHKWDITLDKLPVFKDTIKVITEPLGFYRFYAYRNYDVVDADSNLLINAKSIWIFVNTKIRRPTRIICDMYNKYNVGTEEYIHFEIDDIVFPDKYDYEKEFLVRQDDIDTNEHVNNTVYVIWALEAIPTEIIEDYSIRRIRINYKKETHYGSKIRSLAAVSYDAKKLSTRHLIKDEENNLCIIEIFWEKETI